MRPIVLVLLLFLPARADNLFVASDKGVREVDLDGKTARTLTKVPWAVASPDGCPSPMLPECKTAASVAPKPPDGAYDLQDGTIVAGKKKFARLGAGDFSNEKLSPSGKWAVIGGNISEGDYID